MKAVKIIAIVLGVLLLIVLGAYFAMPSKISVTRTAEINAPVDRVFATASNLQTWDSWTSWAKKDTTMTWTYSGDPANTVGAWQAWKGADGNGKLTYTDVKPNQELVYIMEFEGFKPSTGNMTFEPVGEKTKVSWTMNADMDGIFRLMGPMFTSAMTKDFDEGLANLDAYLAANPAPAPAEDSVNDSIPDVKLEVQ